jgi:hypothetical protein
MEKDELINKEIRRLNKIFKDIEENKKIVAEGLIQEVAFMRVTLNDLKQIINLDGCVNEMSQGSYTITRESPAVKTYNTLIQRYTTSWKQLSDLLNKDDKIKATHDELMEFLKK